MPSNTRSASYIVRLEKNGVQLTVTVQNIRTRAVSICESYSELLGTLERDLATASIPAEETGR